MHTLASLPLLAQAESAPGGGLMSFLPIILIFAAMYFLLIAPQRKKEKKHRQMLAALKVGDKVITIGGVFGTVTAIRDDRVHVKVDDSTRVEMLKSSIQTVREEDSN